MQHFKGFPIYIDILQIDNFGINGNNNHQHIAYKNTEIKVNCTNAVSHKYTSRATYKLCYNLLV